MYASVTGLSIPAVIALATLHPRCCHSLQLRPETNQSGRDSIIEDELPNNPPTYWSEKLAAELVEHPVEDCFHHCGKKSGYCDWCGVGNACCHYNESDHGECFRATGFTALKQHQCVSLEEKEKPILNWHGLDRFIIVPEHKLMFCYVDKVASRNFNDLFATLRLRYDSKMVHTFKYGGWFQNSPFHHGYTKEDLEEMLVSKRWRKAVFYRDPVERFVSAYRSKCEGADSDGGWICADEFGSPHASFSEAIQKIKDFDERQEPLDESYTNVHFRRQSSFCGGLQDTLKYYDFVEPLTQSTSRDKVLKLLHAVGVDPVTIPYLDVIFPAMAAGNGSASMQEEPDSQHNTNTLEHLRDYFPRDHPEYLATLIHHYKDDYNAFKITPPSWEKALAPWNETSEAQDAAPELPDGAMSRADALLKSLSKRKAR
mmetsp:Transcript_102832/g.187742  ORF Transcript_102832/g.187742 Transcript_102832/m.187742 type:complete len:428 (-) Transcript_102832:98-1381(-)